MAQKKRTLTEAHKARMAEGRRTQAEARARAEAEARRTRLQEDLAATNARLAKASVAYETAFQKASRCKGTVAAINKAFDAADKAMSVLMGLHRTKAKLERELSECA